MTALAAVAVLALPPALVKPAMAQGIAITDILGRKVTLRTPVERVVNTFYYEEFTAITGVEGWTKIVGMARKAWEGNRAAIFSRYLPLIPNLAAMPDVGDSEDGSFSAEKVISLKPDVLMMSEYGYTTMAAERDKIIAAGIPVVVVDYNAQTLERHLASTRIIGRIMGTEARAEDIAALYEREYAEIQRRIARTTGPKPKVYVELGMTGADTIGNTYNNSMWGRIATNLGAENIATGKIPNAWGPLAAEAVIAANPDAIFITGSSWLNRPKAVKTGYDMTPEATRLTLKPYVERPGWADLKAVRSGRVYALEQGLARTLVDFAAMQFIAKQLYPAEFGDVDPEASLKAFHAKYLPVPFAGAWMVPFKP